MAYVKNPADDVHIYYEVEGEGAPLVLLHGSMFSLTMWRVLGYVDALAPGRRLILIDARGHGRSEKPHDGAAYATSLLASDVVAVLDDLGLKQADYFGYSLGGRVAYGLGRLAPERFRSMVIGGGSFRASPALFGRMTTSEALGRLRAEGIQAFLNSWEQHLGQKLPRALHSAFLMNDPIALAAYLRCAERESSLEDAFERMTMPVLLFAGDADTEHLEASLIASSRLSNGEFAVIPDAGHASAIARSAVVLSILTGFLAGIGKTARQPAYR